MAVGISTYCFTWRLRSAAQPRPGIPEMVEYAGEIGASVLQICDYEPVEHLSQREVSDVKRAANGNGVALELGTRGVEPETMRRYLELAQLLGVPLVRTMYARFGDVVNQDLFERNLVAAGERFADARVRLALETYEMISTPKLVDAVAKTDNPWVGICLDPANCLAALETPADVVATASRFVNNVHVKDFGYERREGGSGFVVTGRPLGDGQLDHRHMLEVVRSSARPGLSFILEHWLPWQGSDRATCETEDRWTRQGVRVLLDYQGGLQAEDGQ